jgi:ATP-binding cassette subfamily F protein uup
VRRLQELREQRAARRDSLGRLRLELDAGERSGRLVAELVGVGKRFGERTIVSGLDLRIMRGDRLGLVGPNGVGKSTLLRLILGELAADTGTVRLGTNLRVAYFDQLREELDDERSVAETVNPGSDWVEVNGERRHVVGYLGDFLFAPQRLESPVRLLSGGERNRLLLAKLFARPANVLVLDEPTNDLDIESLELLEDTLQRYPGTLLLVSHDRAFLDNVVTQTLAPIGAGQWREYVGGYSDWIAQRPAPIAARASARAGAAASTAADPWRRRRRHARRIGRPSSIIAKAVSSSCCRNRSRRSRRSSRRCTRAWPKPAITSSGAKRSRSIASACSSSSASWPGVTSAGPSSTRASRRAR